MYYNYDYDYCEHYDYCEYCEYCGASLCSQSAVIGCCLNEAPQKETLFQSQALGSAAADTD